MIRADRRITMAIGALVLALAAGWAWQSGFRFGGGDKPAADTVQVGPDGVPRRDEAVSVATAQSRVQDVPVTIDAVGTVQALNTVTHSHPGRRAPSEPRLHRGAGRQEGRRAR